MSKTPSRTQMLRDAVGDLNLCLTKLHYLREDDPHFRLVREKVVEARDWLADYRSAFRRASRSSPTRRPRAA
jgi:hypothetical protein